MENWKSEGFVKMVFNWYLEYEKNNYKKIENESLVRKIFYELVQIYIYIETGYALLIWEQISRRTFRVSD